MADRFPSLQELDSHAPTEIGHLPVELSTNDIVARERALLGDDAEQFISPPDAPSFADSQGDLLGGSEPDPRPAFDAQFPHLSSNGVSTFSPSVTYNSGFATKADDGEEAESVKAWRERRDQLNAKRAADFAVQREQTVKEARQNIDAFYENYNMKRDKLIGQTRKEAEQFVASREDTVSGGTTWDRIAKLVDISGKGTAGGGVGSGKERFRELLISLRKDENAPGVATI